MHARAIGLQLRNVDLPEPYRIAVQNKQAANEDISLAVNQRVQETTRAMTALQSAQQQARRECICIGLGSA